METESETPVTETANPLIWKTPSGWLRTAPGITHVQVPNRGTYHRHGTRRWVNQDGRWMDDAAMVNHIERGAWVRCLPTGN